MAKVDKTKDTSKYFVNPTGHTKDRILILESDDIPKEGQYIALNGFGFLARPGEEVDIPHWVRVMLDTRIETRVEPGLQGIKNAPVRHIPRVKYQLIKENVFVPSEKPDDPANVDKDGQAQAG